MEHEADSVGVGDSVVLVAWDAASDQVMVDVSTHSFPMLVINEAGFGAAVPAAAAHHLGIRGFLVDHIATRPNLFVVASAAAPTPDGLTWVSSDGAIDLVDFPPAKDWLRQRHRPLRPWFAPEWHADAIAYATRVLSTIGLRPRGEPVQVRHWPLSAVMCVPANAGEFYLKTVPHADVCEPCLLELLRERAVPNLPSAAVAHDHDHRRWISAALSGTDGWSLSAEQQAACIRALAELQQATIPLLGQIEAAGVERKPLASFPSIIADLMGRDDLWESTPGPYDRWRGLTEQQRTAWKNAAPWLLDCTQRLTDLADSTGMQASLTHGDFHPGNTQLQADGTIAIYDWSEAKLTHPFMDLGCWIDQMTEPAAQKQVDAYLAAWGHLANPADLADMWRAAKPISGVIALHQAVQQSDEYGLHRHAMIPVVYGWVRRILGSAADPHAETGNWPKP